MAGNILVQVRTGSNYRPVSVSLKKISVGINLNLNRKSSITGPAPSGEDVMVDIVANETISIGDPVTSLGTVADTTNAAHRGKVIGISTQNVTSGFMVRVRTGGLMILPAPMPWSSGKLYLKNKQIASLPGSGSPHTFYQVLGTALNNT